MASAQFRCISHVQGQFLDGEGTFRYFAEGPKGRDSAGLVDGGEESGDSCEEGHEGGK